MLFLILAMICGLVGFRQSKNNNTKTMPFVAPFRPRETWDDNEILGDLVAVSGKPELLTHYVLNLKRRFLVSTEDRTARVRTGLLRTHIEQLELGKQYQNLINDLKALEREQENRLLRLELENRELLCKRDQAETLEKLRARKDRLSIELESAELRAKKRGIKNPPSPGPSFSPEQQRRLKRIDIEEKLRELDRLEQAGVKAARDEDERRRLKNIYADKREELFEQLSKYLV